MTAVTTSQQARAISHNWLRILGIILAIAGLGIAAYMSYAELTGQETSCPGRTGEGIVGGPGTLAVDCGFVQNSIYARAFGIPVALLGMGGYLAILAIWVLEDRIQLLRDFGHMLVFGMALFGFLFSAYLTYTELFIMYTVCTWCLASAVAMTLVFIVAVARLMQVLR